MKKWSTSIQYKVNVLCCTRTQTLQPTQNEINMPTKTRRSRVPSDHADAKLFKGYKILTLLC